MSDRGRAPRLGGVRETALYVDDLERAAGFYSGTLGLETLAGDGRFRAFDAGGRSVLLLFARGESAGETRLSGGVIPGHDGMGPLHVGFSVAADEMEGWVERLAAAGVAVLSEVQWPRGGRSVYFRDPDGHLLELLTPGVWATY